MNYTIPVLNTFLFVLIPAIATLSSVFLGFEIKKITSLQERIAGLKGMLC